MLVFEILMMAVAGCWALAAGWCLFETVWHIGKRRAGWGRWAASSVFTVCLMAIIVAMADFPAANQAGISLAGR